MKVADFSEVERFPEAKRLALVVGCSYADAERVFLRVGERRALDVLTVLRDAHLEPSYEILNVIDPPRPVGDQVAELAELMAKLQGTSRIEPAVYLGDPRSPDFDRPRNRHERRAAAKRARSKQ